MHTIPSIKARCLALLAAVMVMAFSPAPQADESTRLAVVVAKSSPITGLTLNELKRLYLGSVLTGPGGVNVIGVNQAKHSPARTTFERVVLRMSEDELGRYWIDRKIRGNSGPPKSLPSPEYARRAVAGNPTAVTYLRINELGHDVRVIPIDGKLPKAAGYPVE
ncbi:MAG TPA: hypothetical protein VKP30_08710 [Polyangiaceae bacterium]|nr:hypothetical protein [Polyangiaceae bacterium]